MGMEDRDYYWEDRKRREKKFDKKVTYNRPKEFRRTERKKPDKPLNDWQNLPYINKQYWKLLAAFFLGGFVMFWCVMLILNVDPDLLWKAFELSGMFVDFLRSCFN